MNPAEYQSFLNEVISSGQYNSLEQPQQQQLLSELRLGVVANDPDNEGTINSITQRANKAHLRGTGEGRYIPNLDEFNLEGKPLPWHKKDYATKTEEEKEEILESFRNEIPSLAAQDPVNEDDRGFYLNAVIDQEVRQVRGGDTGWFMDKGARMFEGFAAGVASFVGADEKAQDIRNYVADNPKYDDDFGAKLAVGLGDLGASTAVFVGATVMSGSPAGGTAALLAGTSVRKYQDAYNQAIESGMDETTANDAGVGAIPGAAIEIIGDRLIAGRFLPKSFRDTWNKAKGITDKKKLLAFALGDENLKKGAMRVARDAFGEGASEALGDFSSGYGAYMMTGMEDFIPDKDSLIDSFTIGAVLGGGIAGVSEGSQVRKGPDGFTTKNQRDIEGAAKNVEGRTLDISVETQMEREAAVFDLIREGKYSEAYKLSTAPIDPSVELETTTGVEADGTRITRQQSLLFPETAGAAASPMSEFGAQQVTGEVGGEDTAENNIISDGQIAEPTFNQEMTLPFAIAPDTQAKNVSDMLTNPDKPELEEQVNTVAPSRVRVKQEIETLGSENRGVNAEQAQAVQGLVDVVATKWAAANPDKSVDDFYGKLSFKSVDTLRAFNFLADKFVARTKDPKRNRQIGRATAFNQNGQTTVAAAKGAEINSVVTGMVSALRQAGIMEDIVGADGMATIQSELGIREFDEAGDVRLAEGVLDWMRRTEPQNEATAKVYGQLKDWIKDVYTGLREYFKFSSGRLPSRDLDSQLAKIFDFAPLEAGGMADQNLGREVTSSDLFINPNSQLQRSKAATQAITGQTRSTKSGKPVTPVNESTINETETDAQAALNAARIAAAKILGTPQALNSIEESALSDLPSENFGANVSGVRARDNQAGKTLTDSQSVQRGYPENFATIQSVADRQSPGFKKIFSYGTGVLFSGFEHLGDLYHRVAKDGELGAIKSKLENNIISFFSSGNMSLDKEIEQNIIGNVLYQNFSYEEIRAKGYAKLAQDPEIRRQIELAKRYNELAGYMYASMYAQLKAYTPLQALGRNVAIAYGMGRYDLARFLADKMLTFENNTQDIEFRSELGFNPEGVNNLDGRSDNLTKNRWDNLLQIGEQVTDENIENITLAARERLLRTIKSSDLNDVEISEEFATPKTSETRIVASRGIELYFNLPESSTANNGVVSIGKLKSDKQGMVQLKGLEGLIGADGKQVKAAEIELWKMIVPNAFVGDKVNLNVLTEGLKTAEPIIEVKKLSNDETQFTANQTRYYEITHELDTLYPLWVESRTGVDRNTGAFIFSEEDIAENPPELEALLREYNQVAPGTAIHGARPDLAKYGTIAPKAESQMSDYVEVLLRIPMLDGLDKQGLDYQGPHFGNNDNNVVAFFRGYTETLPDGTKSFHMIEIQSDWAQGIRRRQKVRADSYEVASYERGNGDIEWGIRQKITPNQAKARPNWDGFFLPTNPGSKPTEADARRDLAILIKGEEVSSPMLEVFQPLSIKAAIQHAQTIGADSIILSDGETAMMSEGHDTHAKYTVKKFDSREKADEFIRNAPDEIGRALSSVEHDDGTVDVLGPNYVYHVSDKVQQKKLESFMEENEFTPRRPDQEAGMRLNYDKIIPREAERITGVKGEMVNLGTHVKALDRSFRIEGHYPSLEAANARAAQTPIDGQWEKVEVVKGRFGEYEVRITEVLGSPVFRNPDGTRKTSITGRKYKLDSVKPNANQLFTLEEKASNIIQETIDAEYEAALNAGDAKKLQELVDESAAKAGYTETVYHGTVSDKTFDKFRGKQSGIWTAFDEKAAQPAEGNAARVFTLKANRGSFPITLKPEHYKEWRMSSNPMKWIRDFRMWKYKSMGYERPAGSDKTFPTSVQVGEYALVLFEPSQVKSAAPITVDHNNVPVPPSKRFDKNNNSILRAMSTQDILGMLLGQLSRQYVVNGKVITNGLELFETIGTLGEENILSKWVKDPRVKNALLKVKVVSSDSNNHYDIETNTIHLSTDKSRVIQHELSHAILHHSISNVPTFRADIESVMEQAVSDNIAKGTITGGVLRFVKIKYEMFLTRFSPEEQVQLRLGYGLDSFFSQHIGQLRAELAQTGNNIDFQVFMDAYAMTSADEFVAAVMSDPSFRDKLNNIILPDDNRSTLWTKFLEAVRSLIGRDKVTALDGIDNVISGAFESGEVVNRLGTLYDASGKYKKVSNALNSIENANDPKPKDIQRAEEEKVERFFKRFRAIRTARINDKSDGNTNIIMRMLKGIDPNDIMAMPEEGIKEFSELIDNIYEARTSSVPDPALREDSQNIVAALNNYIQAIDLFKIAEMKSEVDGLIDLNKFDGDPTSKAEWAKFINDSLIKAELDIVGNKRSGAGSEAYTKKQEAWREKFEAGRAVLNEMHSTPEDWLEEFQKINGDIKSESLKTTLLAHFDYMSKIANVDEMEGKDLYNHFYAVNNIMDGRVAYMPETTIRHIQALRDGEVDFESIKDKFRDPMLYKNKYIMNLDQVARMTELMQTQLDRWSAFEEARTFMQEDLMGDLLNTIVLEAENNRAQAEDKYVETRKNLEKILKREINGEDRVTMAIVSRLIQFEVGQNANASILTNIQNERKSHENVFDEGDIEAQTLHRETIVPIFDKLVEGIEQSDTPMEAFMESLEFRMGGGDYGLGHIRKQLLYKMMDIVNEFRADQEVISEAFYKKPFRQWANYLPRHTIPTEATKADGEMAPIDLTAPIEDFDQHQYQSMSMTGIPSQLQSRKMKLGGGRYYSNNIESIFDRSIRMSALTASTTAERFILKERLKKGNPVFNAIKGEHRSDRRVRELEAWAKELVYNAMFNGESIGALNGAMKLLNEAYSRVALSGIHQGITQTISGFMDYQWRTGNLSGAMQGLAYYTSNQSKMDAFFNKNAKWITNRSLLGEVELDRKKNPIIDENSIRAIPLVKALEKIHKGAGKVITFSLRTGDDFTAKSLVLAEYTRISKAKGRQINSVADVDWDNPDGKILSQAIINVERNINASNKVLRGKLFTDRNKHVSLIRNVFFAFSSHVMTLSAQLNLAARDIIELKKLGASREQIEPKIRTIGAILGQTVAFSSARYVINGGMALAMISLIQDLYDDEEGKISELELALKDARKDGDPVLVTQAEDALATAETVRKQLDKYKARAWSGSSFYKSVLREEAGVLHFLFQGPQIPQKIFSLVPDKLGRGMMQEEKEAQSQVLKDQIKDLKEKKRFGEAAKLSEQLVSIESMEYIPWNYQNFSNLGIGGITGTTLEAMYKSFDELASSALGLKEVNYNDMILGAQSAGMGQADILRYFRMVDSIEDDLYKRSQALQQEKLPAAYEKQVEKREKQRDTLIKKLIREE